MNPHIDRYRVRSYECTPEGVLRAPELLNYLQETASENARVLGFDFPVFDETTGARGAWVLAQMRIRIDRHPRWRETVLVEIRAGGDDDAVLSVLSDWDARPGVPAVRTGDVHVLTDAWALRAGPRIDILLSTLADYAARWAERQP